jgi:hypothetical protein
VATFIDDDGEEVRAVTSEQHALSNPGHHILVGAHTEPVFGHVLLNMHCTTCGWRNEGDVPIKEGYR